MTLRITAALAIMLGASLHAASLEHGDKAPRFALEDQFGETILFTFPREKPVFLSIADRSGADYVIAWREAIEARYAEDLEFRRIGWLWEVPELARGTVMTLLKTQYGPVLLDWDGATSKRFGAKQKQGYVFIVTHDGYIAAHVEGEMTEAKWAALFKQIDEAIADAQEEKPAEPAVQD